MVNVILTVNVKHMDKIDHLINEVVRQLKTDLKYGDLDVVEEFLRQCPVDVLIDYLPEEDQTMFKKNKQNGGTEINNE